MKTGLRFLALPVRFSQFREFKLNSIEMKVSEGHAADHGLLALRLCLGQSEQGTQQACKIIALWTAGNLNLRMKYIALLLRPAI